jgi:cytochrome c1
MHRFALCACLSLAVATISGCSDPSLHPHAAGDAERGRALLQQYGCGACHSIPGIGNSVGTIGPPLDRLGRRVYVAGVLVNSPDELARWIREPDAVKPGTAMPNAHVTEPDARDIVAYLYALR